MVKRRIQPKRGATRRLIASAVLLAACAAPLTAWAQTRPSVRDPDSFLNQQRAVEERLRQLFDAEVGQSQRALFDWGGWYNYHLFRFDDGVESSRTLRRSDLRLWGRLVLDHHVHELYARASVSLLDFNSGHAYDGNDDDTEGPNLERGYYRFDLGKAIERYGQRRLDYSVIATIGRDLVRFGGGLSLAAPLDHVSIRATLRTLQFTGMFGRTVGSVQDFDLSRTATRTHRDLFGTELKYLGYDRHEPYAYALWQEDRNSEKGFTPFQRFDYDSFHFGLGSTGEITDNLRYATEWVYQSGHDFGQGQLSHRNRIDAWAVQAELEYLYPGESKTRASIEYVFASGDADRRVSPTNTRGANPGNFEDTSFIGFGYQDTGLSFAPRPANLHMVRAGASFYPWPRHARLRNLELGTDWYIFHKHHRAAAVSDPTANVGSGFLGWEMDYFANWQVTGDFAWTGRLGVFFPGRAFDDRSVRTFFLLSMTWSF